MKHPSLFCSLLAIAACAHQLSPPPVATAPPPVATAPPPVQPGPPLTRPNTFIVFFPWNGRSVSPTGREILQQAVAAYRRGAPVTVLVTGYTDGSGSYRYNQRLSARRVWHVTAMLLRMGVPRNALVVSRRGENDNRLPTTNGVREPQHRVKVVGDFVMSAAFSPGGLRHTARVRDAATGREIAVPRGLGSWVQSAAFSPDRSRIVTTSWDNTARIWDAATANEIAVLRGHEGLVWSAVFSPDGSRIVSASDDKTARLWDAATATEIAVLVGHEEGVISAVFSPDGSRIVTVSGDTTAGIWDAATAKEIAVLRGHEGSVFSAAFSPDGSRIVTASDDDTARIWDAATGKEIAVQAVEPAPR